MLRASVLALCLLTSPAYAFDLDTALAHLMDADGPTITNDIDGDGEGDTPDPDPHLLYPADWEDDPLYEGMSEDAGLPVIHRSEWTGQGKFNGQGNGVSLTGEPFFDAAGNYYNVEGDGEVLTAADTNDDAVVTDEENYAYIDRLYDLPQRPEEPDDEPDGD